MPGTFSTYEVLLLYIWLYGYTYGLIVLNSILFVLLVVEWFLLWGHKDGLIPSQCASVLVKPCFFLVTDNTMQKSFLGFDS